MTYRLDIEGLRAVAVLLVVVFHINEHWIPGGFVGVDLFFVISGYVITQRIWKDGLTKPADFLEFYRRRIRRIAPAMLFVTAITLIVGAFLLLPADLVDLSWSALASAFSVANIYFSFFLDTSYFAKDSNYVPLLHLWSLGVEEQFYLIWPLLLFGLMRWPRALFPTLAVIMIASVLCGEYWLRTDQYTLAYYMLPSRAFQLCAGGACVFLVQTSIVRRVPAGILLICGVIGLALVAGSAVLLNGQVAFPGFNAVPVTVGGALLLISGTKAHFVTRLLSVWPARKIGNLSYSMYLWHWPVLAYLRYAYVKIDFQMGVMVFLAIICLSALSVKFIEEPFRHSDKSFLTIFTRMFVIPTSALTAVSVAFIALNGFVPYTLPQNYKEQIEALNDKTKPAYAYPYVCQRAPVMASDLVDENCIINNVSAPTTLLWGDSNASHYIGILGEIAKSEGVSFRNIEHPACPPLLQGAATFAHLKYKKNCIESIERVKGVIDSYDHIIISASYSMYDTFSQGYQDAFRDTILALRSKGKEVTIVGQSARFANYDTSCKIKALKAPINCQTHFVSNAKQSAKVNASLKVLAASIDGVKYIDFNELICPDGACSPYLDGQPIFFDNIHISMEGSWLLGKKAVASKMYPPVFTKLVAAQ